MRRAQHKKQWVPGQFASVEGMSVHYVDLPRTTGVKDGGSPAVLVHGKNGSVYDYLMSPLFPDIRRRRRVLAMDRMGCGFSRQPRECILTLEAQARIAQGLLEQLGVRRPVMVGHSLGASVCLAHALMFPGEAAGYVLLAPIAYGVPALGAAAPEAAARSGVTNLISKFLLLNGRLYNRRLVRLAFAPNQDCVPDRFVEKALELLLDPEQFEADLRNALTVNASLLEMAPRYGSIDSPVAILAGARDVLSRVNTQARPLAEALPDSALTVLPDTGHMLQFVRPAEVLEAIDSIARPAVDHVHERPPRRIAA